MRQKVFTFAATSSVVLCVSTAVLWMRSAAIGDYFICRREDRAFSLISEHGVVRWTAVRYTRGDPPSPVSIEHFSTGRNRLEGFRRLVEGVDDPLYGMTWSPDFRIGAGSGEGRFSEMHDLPLNGHIPPDFKYRYVAAPHFLLVAVTALLPAAWVGRWLWARRRFRPGLCKSCGYDLRATPDRCPECGEVCAAAVTHAQPSCRK